MAHVCPDLTGEHSASSLGPPSSWTAVSSPFPGESRFLSPNSGGPEPSHRHQPGAGTQIFILLHFLPSFKLECPLGNHRHLKFSVSQRNSDFSPKICTCRPVPLAQFTGPPLRHLPTQDRNLGITPHTPPSKPRKPLPE